MHRWRLAQQAAGGQASEVDEAYGRLKENSSDIRLQVENQCNFADAAQHSGYTFAKEAKKTFKRETCHTRHPQVYIHIWFDMYIRVNLQVPYLDCIDADRNDKLLRIILLLVLSFKLLLWLKARVVVFLRICYCVCRHLCQICLIYLDARVATLH